MLSDIEAGAVKEVLGSCHKGGFSVVPSRCVTSRCVTSGCLLSRWVRSRWVVAGPGGGSKVAGSRSRGKLGRRSYALEAAASSGGDGRFWK